MFGDTETQKEKFYHRKKLILLEHDDTDKIQVSSVVSSGEKIYKYLTDYKDVDHKIKPLCIIFSKTSGYAYCFNNVETKWMYFLLRMMNFWKTITVFRIKSVIVLEKNLIANLSTIKTSENQNKVLPW